MKILVLRLSDTKVDDNKQLSPTTATVYYQPIVPLYRDFNYRNPIGSAKLLREGNDFYITDLQGKIPSELNYLTPAISGMISAKESKDGIDILRSFSIDMVAFISTSNSDNEIKSVGEQLKEQQSIIS